MTRTISLIIGVAVVALVAVPTAFGEGRLAGSSEQSGVAYFYANERATLAQQPVTLDRRTDAFGRSDVAQQSTPIVSERTVPSRPDVGTYLDANGRGALSRPDVSTYRDANERVDLPTTPVSAPVASSGRDVEWPQIGIGFGIGIALAIVLGLSLKATRPRTLAH